MSLYRVTLAVQQADRAAKNRDDAIRRASERGETIRAIAIAAGLSPARVHQILHASKP